MVIFSPCLEFLTLGLGKLEAREGLEESMNWLRFLSIVSCLILISGCAYTTKPIGERQTKVSPEDWEGVWVHHEGAMNIEVLDEANGVIQVAWIEEGESEEFERNSYRVHLTTWGNWEFFSAKEREESEHYMWGRFEKEGGQIIAWIPDVGKFQQLVEEGILPGKVDGHDVILGDLTDEHIELITSSAKGVLFAWDHPLVLLRVGK